MQLTGPRASHAVLAHEAIDPRDPEAAKADMESRRFRKVSLLLIERDFDFLLRAQTRFLLLLEKLQGYGSHVISQKRYSRKY